MSSNQDPVRLIAERVARRIGSNSTPTESPAAGVNEGEQSSAAPRARVIDFISATPPARTQPSISVQVQTRANKPEPAAAPAPQVAQSPWLAPFARAENYHPQSAMQTQQSIDHPSQERFGVAEAAVSELVEFFENEKQCSVDPSGKPCDHCAMCSSRGF